MHKVLASSALVFFFSIITIFLITSTSRFGNNNTQEQAAAVNTVGQCIGDLDGDGAVGSSDLSLLVNSWGNCAETRTCVGDFDSNGHVDGWDLALLLGNWGTCPIEDVSQPPGNEEETPLTVTWPDPTYGIKKLYGYTGGIDNANNPYNNLIGWHSMATPNSLNNAQNIWDTISPAPIGERTIFIRMGVYRDDLYQSDKCVNPQTGLATSHECFVWNLGTAITKLKFLTFFTNFYAIGGKIDRIVFDDEHDSSISFYGIMQTPQGNEWCQAIENDPELPIIQDAWGYDGDVTDLCNNPNSSNIDARLSWNEYVVRERIAEALNESIYNMAKLVYPNVQGSNYGNYHWNEDFDVPLNNGQYNNMYGTGSHVGTHQSKPLYGGLGAVTSLHLPYYDPTPFNAFRFSANQARSAILSSDVPFIPWFSYKGLSGSYLKNNDLYQENIFHAGLAGSSEFHYWEEAAAGPNSKEYFDSVMTELNHMIGYNTTKKTLITDISDWNNRLVYTGMRVGDYEVFRVTPELETGETKEAYLINNTPGDIRFKVRRHSGPDKILRFSGETAIIYQPANPISNQGFWVVQRRTDPNPSII